MSPVFAARRRAEEFDSLVAGSPATGADDARYGELLEVVGALRATPPAQPRPEFAADLRERLMAAAATELAGASDQVDRRLTVPARTPRERRLAIAVGGFAIVGATTSMAMAAQTALPGDVLYPLKRAIENAETGITVGDSEKGASLLANATGRLEEVNALALDAGDQDVPAIEETLSTFSEQATEASDLIIRDYQETADEQALLELQAFTQQSFEALDGLAAVLPDDARDALVEAGNTLASIDAALQAICETCEPVLIAVPRWLLADAATQQGLDGAAGTSAVADPIRPVAKTDGKPGGAKTGGGTAPTQPAPAPGSSTPQQPAVTLPSSPSQTGGPQQQGPGGGEGGNDPIGTILNGATGGTSTSTGGPSAPTGSDEPGDALPDAGDVIDGVTGQLP